MNLELKRTYLKENYTIGNLSIDGKFYSNTLEDRYRDLNIEAKIYGKTCIPYGTYRVVMSWSNRFQRVMPELLYVPEFTAIRIHSGNTQADTEGCILLGKNDVVGQVTRSRFYSDNLNKILLEVPEKIFINII